MEGQRITEDGNLRVTSTSDTRITEDYVRTNVWIVQPTDIGTYTIQPVSTDTWTVQPASDDTWTDIPAPLPN